MQPDLIWLAPVFLLTCVLTLPADELPTEKTPSAQEITHFEKQIRPLLAKRCYACHSQRAGKREGGLALDRRSGWINGGDRGPAVVPGKPNQSLLIQAIQYEHADLQMPPSGKLAETEIDKLERWVQRGAPAPQDSESPSGGELQHPPSDPVAGRTHWAFQPLRDSPLPTPSKPDWALSPYDPFLLSQLEQHDLAPTPDAERDILIRRLSFQLLGLPPDTSLVESFREDARPDAWERVVDRLLSSPHFGERWGRHWLDLARYADSNGLDENFLFREAWRYRNWVIDAVNQDLTFDHFLLQQVAGDLLPHTTTEQHDRQRIAAGFLVIGPKVLLGNSPDERRMDVADEQIDTLGRTVLGQTLGCARCHDHKFDPIPTADYYALAGIFTSTQVMERRYMLGQQRLMEQLIGIGPEGEQADANYETFWRERPQRDERVKQAKAALDLLVKGDLQAFGDFAKQHANVIAEAARDEGQAMEARVAAQQARLKALQSQAQPPSIPPRAMIPIDVDKPADESIRLSGQFDRCDQKVPRGFLQVISDSATGIPPEASGRLQLGRWLTDTHHGAGNLAARVQANRIWQHLMGRGIVRTVDNFGRTGEPPSHPELLDYLAADLIRADWSLKQMIRRIVHSRAYQMSSAHRARAQARDPDNRLWWRAHRVRLEPEALRDAMLMTADALDLRPMESSVWYLGDQATAVGDNKNRRRTNFPCRSVYLPVIRNDLPELFDVFDFANPHATTGLRPDTMVAPQGLFLLNDESVMQAARQTAQHVLASETTDEQRLNYLFARMYNQPCSAADQQQLLAFLRDIAGQAKTSDNPDPQLTAWSLVCQALFAASRFQILD